MAQYLVDTGKVKHISGEKVRQILHKKRVSFKKAKLHITSPDDQYEVKKNELKTSKQIIQQTQLSSMRMNVVL
jgi:hypothetical protein